MLLTPDLDLLRQPQRETSDGYHMQASCRTLTLPNTPCLIDLSSFVRVKISKVFMNWISSKTSIVFQSPLSARFRPVARTPSKQMSSHSTYIAVNRQRDRVSPHKLFFPPYVRLELSEICWNPHLLKTQRMNRFNRQLHRFHERKEG